MSYSAVTGNNLGIHQAGIGSAVKSLGNNHITDNAGGDSGSLTTGALR